jgi:hypothetical protein
MFVAGKRHAAAATSVASDAFGPAEPFRCFGHDGTGPIVLHVVEPEGQGIDAGHFCQFIEHALNREHVEMCAETRSGMSFRKW